MFSEWQLRRQLCDVARRVYERGLVAGTDGNVSARLQGDRLLISPSGSSLGLLEPGDLVTIDFSGHVVSGRGRASSERWMHIAAYRERPDAMAAIHAHPPTVIAFTVAGMAMAQCALPEVILAFGQVPVAAYATPATREGAEVVREPIKLHDALVLDRHGSLTIGKSPLDAFFKLDKLEHGARVLFMARQLGATRDLPPEEVAKLAALRREFGLGPAPVAAECLPPGTPAASMGTGGETY